MEFLHYILYIFDNFLTEEQLIVLHNLIIKGDWDFNSDVNGFSNWKMDLHENQFNSIENNYPQKKYTENIKNFLKQYGHDF